MLDTMEISEPPSKASSDLNVPAPDNGDVEAAGEKADEVAMRDHPRKGFPTWKWILSLIGLYLGALLYGTTAHVWSESTVESF